MRRLLGLIAACAACSGAAPDPSEVLARLTAIVRSQAERVPNYTCVQTIDRTFFQLASYRSLSCAQTLELERKGDFHPRPATADRFRLEVRVGPDSEMYSWVGANRFDDRRLHELLGAGPSSTGSFAPVLLELFGEGIPDFHFEGERTINNWPAYAYSFKVPVERSTHRFILRDKSLSKVAYEGTIFANRETGAPIRLDIAVNDAPPGTDVCRYTTELNYRRARIGSADFMLPFEAIQNFVQPNGTQVESTVTFSACREYLAESRLVADAGERETETPAPQGSRPGLPIPEGLLASIMLTTSVDTATAAAGDPVAGVLIKALVDGTGAVLAPGGTPVHARVTGLTRTLAKPNSASFRIAIETIEIGGRSISVRMAPVRVRQKLPSPGRGLQSRGTPIGDLPELPALTQATFGCSEARCVIKEGTVTEWMTLGQ